MRQRQILEVNEVNALAEDLRLMVLLDAEPVPRMLPPQTFFKDCQNFPVLHGLRARFWVEQGWPNAT